MERNYCLFCMKQMHSEICEHCGENGDYVAPVHHLKPGTVLREKYLIGKALGEGGFGIAYVGRDLTLDMRIAVKEYYPNGYSNRNHNFSNEVTLTQGDNNADYEKICVVFLMKPVFWPDFVKNLV